MAKLLDLTQQRRFERVDGGEHLIDAAEFGLRARRDDDPGGASGNDERS